MTDLVTDLQTLAARFDPDALEAADVNGVITDLGQALRLVQGMLTLAARRTSNTTAKGGETAAAARLARATGTTPSQAKKTLATSTRLKGQDKVAAAVRAGRLSATQAEAIADAAEADPNAQDSLLQAADQQTVADLRRTCRDTRMKADPDRDATRARHLARRSFRSWTEPDGEWKAMISGPADHGARFGAALRADHDTIFKAAYGDGRRADDACYRYDALLALIERGAADDRDPDGRDADSGHATPDAGGTAGRRSGRPQRRTGRQTKVIVTVPAAALNRDRLEEGETCTIAGIGQVSLAAVKALIPDAHIAYLIHSATDATVIHHGRQASAHQRTALEARGYECEVPHCRATHLLEIDHIRDWAWSKQTVLTDLAWHCR
ncbi:MAG TPA: HNH endonuclease signature motif containing protein, partial [Euzebya sp.]|nr:HNH endonuclease signature motif containing protein [Euzebya sp.]